MLENVLDAYLETVEEREFDAPFMALLRSKGYFDIHHTHGPLEFGKDVIAKLDTDGKRVQDGFQLKAGDVRLSGWREVKPQLEEIIYNKISHLDRIRLAYPASQSPLRTRDFDDSHPGVVKMAREPSTVRPCTLNADAIQPAERAHPAQHFTVPLLGGCELAVGDEATARVNDDGVVRC